MLILMPQPIRRRPERRSIHLPGTAYAWSCLLRLEAPDRSVQVNSPARSFGSLSPHLLRLPPDLAAAYMRTDLPDGVCIGVLVRAGFFWP